MKIMIAVLMTALLVFASATAWVDYVQPQMENMARAATAKANDSEELPIKRRTRKARPAHDDDLLPVPGDDNPDSAHVARRSESEISAKLKEQLDDVKERETRLVARQEALRMMYDDIRSELSAMDEIRQRASDELAVAARGKPDVAQRNSTAKAASPRSTNAPVVAKNPSETALVRGEALLIRRMAEQGKAETAISMLKNMKAREAASVLASLSTVDRVLAERLAEGVRADADGTVRR